MQDEELIDVDHLSNFIRQIDGNHSLGAGALAEQIASYIESLESVKQLKSLASKVLTVHSALAGEVIRERFEAQSDGWAEHPDYPPSDWARETEENNTRLGYWAWVSSQIDIEEQSRPSPQ